MSNKNKTHPKNAADLFEGNDRQTIWPTSSESFWTTLFALFALHLGCESTPRGGLTVWHASDGSNAKWYAPRPGNSILQFTNLTFDSLSVEPAGGLWKKGWPGVHDSPPLKVAGFSPDIVIKSSKAYGGDHFVLIENKIKGALRKNQRENYPLLADWLVNNRVSFDVFLLQSAGCRHRYYEDAKFFQGSPWRNHFGILLWEEVLREMLRTEFTLPALPVQSWQVYTGALNSDCAEYEHSTKQWLGGCAL